MLIDKIYKTIQQLSNKDQVSGILSPAEFNRYLEFAQRDYIEENYNRIDGMGYESNLNNSDALSPIKKSGSITVLNGKAEKPSDYLHYSQAYSNYIFKGSGRVSPIEIVRDDEWAERLASEVNRPTRLFPIMRHIGNSFEVYPAEISNITLTYLKVPSQPWWNYTLSGSTPVFAETGGVTTNPNSGVTAGDSTDVEVQAFEDLVFKICKYMGIELREQDLYQYSSAEQQQQ